MTGIDPKYDLSIIIVNYKTPLLLDKCIGSILKYTVNVGYEIIIVDNFSEDDSESQILNKYNSAKWISMPANEGTPRAWNQGIRNSSGNYILILNSDTEFFDNAIGITLEKYRQLELKNKTGLLSCQLKDYDEIILFNSNVHFPGFGKYLAMNPLLYKIFRQRNTFNLTDEEKRILHTKEHESCWLGIPFGLFNADICKKDGLYFDEDIFMYSEDVEWCRRLKKHGYHHFFTPVCTVFHLNTGSSPDSDWRKGQVLVSEWLYLLKTNGKFMFLLFLLLLWFNQFINYLTGLKNIFRTSDDLKTREQQENIFFLKVLKKYGFKVMIRYSKKPSSAHNFLKYDIG
jgi:GT2 family glycosyltransferase